MVNYSTSQVLQMSDAEFLATIRTYSMPSQWTDGAAFDYALSRLTHMNGRRYAETGNVKAFTHSMR